MTGTQLQDTHGRTFRSIRVSVTDRCNLRCHYCMPPEGVEWFPRSEILSWEELARVTGVAVANGVRRVRVTGGEPLVRRNLPEFLRMISALPGLEDLSLTTNGVLLAEQADELAGAGLQRVNVSLDSLDRATYERLTRRDALPRVLESLDAAVRLFPPVKVNTVLVRGLNDSEPLRFAGLAREKGIAVRFIEYMPLDGGSGWGPERVVTGAEARRRIEAVHPLEPVESGNPAQPSCDYRFADGAPGRVGFVDPMTSPFCDRCDRVRLTADGKLKNCMFDSGEIDVREVLRSGAGDEAITSLLRVSARSKGSGGLLTLRKASEYRTLRSMSRLGG
jgi:cyclic pyranopterin phosphate synthase